MSQIIEATPPDLHSGQIEVIQALDENRFVIAVCGRRWGKTTAIFSCSSRSSS
jgi:hypothetical protein